MAAKRILIVDDELPAARMLKQNLEATGRYLVRVENWPEDAVSVAREFQPDLLLLDVLMPRMPGGNVAAAFRADPLLQTTPIIFLTAAVGAGQIEENDGVICDFPCIAKPASVEEIARCIDAHLRPDSG